MDILVVDDSGEIEDLLGSCGLAEEYNFFSVDVKNCILALDEQHFDAVFLNWGDSKVQDMVPAIRRFGEDHRYYIPIVATFFSTEPGEAVHSLSVGADDFVVIDYDKDSLVNRMEFIDHISKIRSAVPQVKDHDMVITRLIEEHIFLRRLMEILEKIAHSDDREIPVGILEWISSAVYIIDIGFHHKKEDAYFAALVDRIAGGEGDWFQDLSEVSFLKNHEDHMKLNGLVSKLQQSIQDVLQGVGSKERLDDAICQYTAHMLAHLEEEETTLYPFSEKRLTKEDKHFLIEEFDKIDATIGVKTLEERLEAVLKFSDSL